MCAQTGTVFDPVLGRCEYCELVYPCNADPNNIRCATFVTSSTPAKPTCPPYDPNVYICVCDDVSCNLILITTTTPAPPTCPPYDPNVYTCICDTTSCILELITTTTPAPPTCPPYDPNVYVCVCSDITCTLELITTTTSPASAVTDPCPGTTRGTTISNFVFDCNGKPNGDYADPFNPCSGYFWSCTNGDAFYKVIYYLSS